MIKFASGALIASLFWAGAYFMFTRETDTGAPVGPSIPARGMAHDGLFYILHVDNEGRVICSPNSTPPREGNIEIK